MSKYKQGNHYNSLARGFVDAILACLVSRGKRQPHLVLTEMSETRRETKFACSPHISGWSYLLWLEEAVTYVETHVPIPI
jgi:hypothetical protein